MWALIKGPESKRFLTYLLKFLGVYFILHLAYLGVIWLASPYRIADTGPYLKFINVVEWLREFILFGAGNLLSLLGFNPVRIAGTHIMKIGSMGGVNLNNSCLGIGVISFWIAFVFANHGSKMYKLKWMMTGFAFICVLNMVRVAVLLVALNKKWALFLNIEQHTLFNVFAYLLVFLLIYIFTTSQKKSALAVT